MHNYLNITEHELLSAYKAKMSFRELIDKITIESAIPDTSKPINDGKGVSIDDPNREHDKDKIGGKNTKLDNQLDNPTHQQPHNLLADTHNHTHSLNPSVIRVGLVTRCSDYLLAVIVIVLWLDKHVSPARYAMLAKYDLDYTTICRGLQVARRLQLARRIRSLPMIGLRYKAKYTRG